MNRPLRIEFPGAVYHVTSRGDRREAIYAADEDRTLFLDVLAQATERFHAKVLAYCLMGNHYHLVLQTRDPNLSLLMRHLNGVYTQAFNRRHGLTGHLFQGRFKAILVDTEAYLLTLCQYVELNPVRARMVEFAQDWPWSSYRAHIGRVEGPAWLDLAAMARFILQREPLTAVDHALAAKRYSDLIEQSPPEELWADALRQQIYLGGEDFVQRMLAGVSESNQRSADIPKPQRAKPRGLADWLSEIPDRGAALRAAHIESGIPMSELARELNLSVGRISQLIKKANAAKKEDS
ncbi:MAG: transposase [Inhella sp.]